MIGAAFVTHPFDLWFFFDLRMEIVDLAKKVKLLQLGILLKCLGKFWAKKIRKGEFIETSEHPLKELCNSVRLSKSRDRRFLSGKKYAGRDAFT